MNLEGKREVIARRRERKEGEEAEEKETPEKRPYGNKERSIGEEGGEGAKRKGEDRKRGFEEFNLEG